MVRFLVAVLLALAGTAASAGENAPAAGKGWVRGEDRMRLPLADISVPVRAGAVVADETKEFTNQGEWLDSAVIYASADKQMHATIYVYYPALAHSGLTAIATDFFVRPQSTSGGDARVIAAGGRDGIAIRQSYTGYRGTMASEAAYLRAGDWIVKLRVSGPPQRSDEVAATMKALLDGLVFGKGAAPRPALPIALDDCPAEQKGAPARLLPDEVNSSMIPAMVDAGGHPGGDGKGNEVLLPTRVPNRMCRLEVLNIGEARIPLFRALSKARGAGEGSTALVAILTDGGGFLEVVERPQGKGFVVLHHRVGETFVLGRFDALPSPAQISSLLQGDAASAVRGSVHRKPGQPYQVRTGDKARRI